MRVLVTRPQPQADGWVARLRAAGFEAEALPLIEIAAPQDAAAVAAAWATLAQRALVVFVSPNAVARFAAQRPAGAPWPAGVRAGATGPGTSAALREAGVPEADIVEPDAASAQFDSEALWSRLAPLRDWRGASVLVVRGERGRDWLADRLLAAGAAVDFVEAYRREAPRLDAQAQAVLQGALAEPRRQLWLFSSSEAIAHLEALAPGAAWASARAFASHPRIAARAAALGVGDVRLVGPSWPAVLAALREAAA